MRIFDNKTSAPTKPKKKGNMLSRSLDALGKHHKNLNKKRANLRKKIGSSIFGDKTYQSIEDYRKNRRGR